jgi:hypothetical protein
MEPVEFAEQTHTLAKDQPQYRPLPVHMVDEPERRMISCWKLTWLERLQLLISGRLWLMQMTFGDALQPLLPQVNVPFAREPIFRRRPKRELLGLTWCGWLNVLVLQWLGLRLAYSIERADSATVTEWRLMRWIVPLTGWWHPYRYFGWRLRS